MFLSPIQDAKISPERSCRNGEDPAQEGGYECYIPQNRKGETSKPLGLQMIPTQNTDNRPEPAELVLPSMGHVSLKLTIQTYNKQFYFKDNVHGNIIM